MPAGTKNQGGN